MAATAAAAPTDAQVLALAAALRDHVGRIPLPLLNAIFKSGGRDAYLLMIQPETYESALQLEGRLAAHAASHRELSEELTSDLLGRALLLNRKEAAELMAKDPSGCCERLHLPSPLAGLAGDVHRTYCHASDALFALALPCG